MSSMLILRHAIDWIQDQCQLRVLVGRRGTTMFTLNVPKDYPATRGITLQNSGDLNNVELEDVSNLIVESKIVLSASLLNRT